MINYIFWAATSLTIILFILHRINKIIPIELPENSSQRYGSIDGMRGILSILVFFYHYYLVVTWQNGAPWELPHNIIIQNIGNMSVKIFFMITAYLFSKKVLYSSKKVSWKNLYISRAFRIIPLYFLAFAFTIIYSLIIASPSTHTIFSSESFQYLLGWLLFTSNDLFWYSDAAKITAGVTWTLKYEWVFYFSLPLILFLMKNKSGGLIPLLLAVLVFSHTNISLLSTDAFIPFLFGYLAAMSESSKNVYLQKLSLTKKLPYAGLILVLFFIPSKKFHGIIASIPAFIIFIKSADNSIGNSILKMKSVIYLGEISYSIYLLHGVVLFTIAKIIGIKIENYMMPIISILVIATASITYKTIEKPFIKIGRNITRKNKA